MPTVAAASSRVTARRAARMYEYIRRRRSSSSAATALMSCSLTYTRVTPISVSGTWYGLTIGRIRPRFVGVTHGGVGMPATSTLRAVPVPGTGIDLVAAEQAATDFLHALGINTASES